MRRSPTPRARLLAALLITLLMGAGCWDRKEVEDIGFVLAVGLDQGQDHTFEVTFQIASPRSIAGGSPAAGGPGGGGAKSAPVVVERVRETSVNDAIRTLELRSNRRISLVQLRLLVIGRDLARDGAGEVAAITRSREVRQTLILMMADGTAEEILRLNPALERDPSVFLEDLTRRAYERTAWAPRMHLHDFLVGYETLGRDPMLPIVHSSKTTPGLKGEAPDSKPEMKGTAIFRGDQLACELEPQETEMLLMLTRRSKTFIESLPLPDDPNRLVSLQISTESQDVRMDVSGAEPRFTLSMRLEGEIREAHKLPERWATPEGIARLGEVTGARLQERANKLIRRLQEDCGTDTLGLGERLQMRFLDYASWERYNWPSHFPRATVTAQVRAYIRRTGLTIQSPIPK